jgi:pimeloyl-ACP methyl ester carboxylesterase
LRAGEDDLSDSEVITTTTHRLLHGRAGSGGATRLRLAGAATGVDAREARVSVPGGVLACTIAGSGEPLLLVHGLAGTRRTWRQVIGSLAATHTVIAPDLPGHGESEAPAGERTRLS